VQSVTHICSIVLYADDISLIALSISELQRLMHNCEKALAWLDMRVNVTKAYCLRIGPRFDVACTYIVHCRRT